MLPILEVVREREAEQSARDDGARVLQRAFGGLLARRTCRHVCYELMEVNNSHPKGDAFGFSDLVQNEERDKPH